MNLLALLAGLLPWAATPVSAFTRLYLACSLLSLEAQVLTWLGRGTLDSLVLPNVAIATALAIWQVGTRRPVWRWIGPTCQRLPFAIALVWLVVVAGLNLSRPPAAADPYQLDRIRQIERVGTLAYSLELEPKANIVAAFYELMLADLAGVPVAGPWFIQLHGLFGLGVFALAVAAAQTWLPPGSSWTRRALPFVVPVVFHQMILVKSDLFLGAPTLVALAWAVSDPGRAMLKDVLWAGWLAGLVVAAKLTNAAVALALGLVLYARSRDWRQLVTTAAGVAIGIVVGGLVLTLWQNTRFYGDPFAALQVDAMGNINRTPSAALVGLTRFLISVVDMSVFTRQIWPGRGGWGGSFGLPLLWSFATLASTWRHSGVARRATAAGLLCLVPFAIVFPDADLSHRLVIGPGVMLVLAALAASRDHDVPWMRHSLVVVVVLSAAQILRSAALYLMTA